MPALARRDLIPYMGYVAHTAAQVNAQLDVALIAWAKKICVREIAEIIGTNEVLSLTAVRVSLTLVRLKRKELLVRYNR